MHEMFVFPGSFLEVSGGIPSWAIPAATIIFGSLFESVDYYNKTVLNTCVEIQCTSSSSLQIIRVDCSVLFLNYKTFHIKKGIAKTSQIKYIPYFII